MSVAPPGQKWHLVPTVAAGAGVVSGYLHSPSTKRLGLVTLTDWHPESEMTSLGPQAATKYSWAAVGRVPS